MLINKQKLNYVASDIAISQREIERNYNMQIKQFSNGLLSSNSYVVWENEECMIIDLGVNPTEVSSFISRMNLKVKYLVLTHGHYDHAHYVGNYIDLYPDAAVICHEDEIKVLTDETANVSSLIGCPCSYDYEYTAIKDGDILTIGTLSFKALCFPGHTPGCMCLLNEENKIMFTGDVIFASGYGRTDFKYGDPSLMIKSLRKISTMDKDITIYPGHGESARLKNIF